MGVKKELQKINADLQRERKNATISSEEFAQWWAGGREALQKRRALDQLFFDDPEFIDDVHISYMSHKELFEHTLIKATKFFKKLRSWQEQELRESKEEGIVKTDIQAMYDFRMMLSGPLGCALFQQNFPLRLHFSMFLPTLLGQCTEEQKEAWLKKAWNMNGWIGTYAQTELGHGTFIRGLETRADYDIEREEFVLNTPTLTAYKFWPGGLGHVANVVVAMAQLYIKDKHYGLYPFLVGIRNEETHLPEEGIEVGEIGAKIGCNGVNNGYLAFHNVRIPRKQMLMKNAQVLPNGKFIKGSEPLLTYGTMVFVRVMIVRDTSFALLQAATIATRYSVVRRQSPIELNQPEPQILDHLTQQAKILPEIAKGIFYRLAADNAWKLYQNVVQELDTGNKRNLPELHALSCCLKAICSQGAVEGVETLRKSCGGHGYLSSANFGNIFGAVAAACTYEGENTVLLLQAGRFLIKNYVDGLKRKVLPKTVTYLRSQTRLKWSKDPETLVRAIEVAAAEKVRLAFEHLRLKRKQCKNEQVALNLSGIIICQAARLHGFAYIARISYEEMKNISKQISPVLSAVLTQLLEVFLIDIFLNCLSDMILSSTISKSQIANVEARFEQLMAGLRPNAVAIVDGFDFHDNVLGSTLGCYDGRVYERLMEVAKKSPLNQEPVNNVFHTHLKPLLIAKL